MKNQHLDAMREHSVRDYPSECCGVLLGRAEGDSKQVTEVAPLTNLRRDAGRAQEFLPLKDPGRETDKNRYLIDPLAQLRVEKDARRRGLDVLGYYHSHPDHPALPSDYDRDCAWPWYSYVIITVEQGAARDFTSWVLAADRSAFAPEPVDVTD